MQMEPSNLANLPKVDSKLANLRKVYNLVATTTTDFAE